MRLLVCSACLVALSVLGQTSDGAILGPGNIGATNVDAGHDLIAVDTTTFLLNASPGTYAATQFNYQFAADPSSGGTIRPIVVQGDVTQFGIQNLVVVAVGESITYGGASQFVSSQFGDNNSFTLSSTKSLFAGFYWDGSPGQLGPIGFQNGVGNTYISYFGAPPPVVGQGIGMGQFAENFPRAYDFSVEISGPDGGAVPEPATLAIWSGIGLMGLVGAYRRRRNVAA